VRKLQKVNGLGGKVDLEMAQKSAEEIENAGVKSDLICDVILQVEGKIGVSFARLVRSVVGRASIARLERVDGRGFFTTDKHG
jgi:hypothetical protein